MAAGNGRNSGTASAKGLSSFVLKVVAIVGMTCNHAAYVFAGHLPFVGECVLFAANVSVVRYTSYWPLLSSAFWPSIYTTMSSSAVNGFLQTGQLQPS